MTAARRALARDNLVTRREARDELRCSWDVVDSILVDCHPVRAGRTTLYRWGEILDAADGPAKRSAASVEAAVRRRSLAAVDDDWC